LGSRIVGPGIARLLHLVEGFVDQEDGPCKLGQ
jgi:hypothetical protein